MLELVFFLWFGSKQLTRGAQLLTQVRLPSLQRHLYPHLGGKLFTIENQNVVQMF